MIFQNKSMIKFKKQCIWKRKKSNAGVCSCSEVAQFRYR